MQEDGSFGASLDVDYGNAYATVQAALTVGVYENGSLIDNIKAQYDEMLNPKMISQNQHQLLLRLHHLHLLISQLHQLRQVMMQSLH